MPRSFTTLPWKKTFRKLPPNAEVALRSAKHETTFVACGEKLVTQQELARGDYLHLAIATAEDNAYERGITKRTVSSVQQGLKILHDAETLVPVLKGSRGAKVTTETMRKVFIVHGHDELMKQATARFVTKLGLEPVILHEQPNGGRTIIEKFLDHADVGFSLVLLAGDDRGGLASHAPESYQLRARQNVIFELGFFIGRLDRSRVVALHTPGVVIPSDYSGVIFVSFDKSGIWEIQVAKEMRAAGLKVDLNKL